MTISNATRADESAPVPQITDTWLVIPLYNEATVVREVVSRAREIFPYIVAVDDGSKDDSARENSKIGRASCRERV